MMKLKTALRTSIFVSLCSYSSGFIGYYSNIRSNALLLPTSKVVTVTNVCPLSYQCQCQSPSVLCMSSSSMDDVSNLLYQEQEKLIVRRGELEEDLIMSDRADVTVLKTIKMNLRGVGKAGGFGGGSNSKSNANKSSFKVEAKAYSKELIKNGVVRIDNAISSDVADSLREFVSDLRKRSEEEVTNGSVQSIQRFADVLLKSNRCDLTIPVGDDIVTKALNEALRESPVGQTIASILSDDAILYELSCLISDPGSQRQVIHPDTPFLQGKGPVLYTTFIALQDICLDMGPTTWLPGTHTFESHEKFKDDNSSVGESKKDVLIRNTELALGILPKGSCAIFDSRLLHCGTANKSDTSRALFYFSFKSSDVGYPGNPASIRPELGSEQVSMSSIIKDLESFSQGKGQPLIDSLAAKLR